MKNENTPSNLANMINKGLSCLQIAPYDKA